MGCFFHSFNLWLCFPAKPAFTPFIHEVHQTKPAFSPFITHEHSIPDMPEKVYFIKTSSVNFFSDALF
jgi:hypothetical protein